jgi:hypothetical protein
MAAPGQAPLGDQGGDEGGDPSRKRKRDQEKDENPPKRAKIGDAEDQADSSSTRRSSRAKRPGNVETALHNQYYDLVYARIEEIIRAMKKEYTVYEYSLTDPNDKNTKGKQGAATTGPDGSRYKTGGAGKSEGSFGRPNMHSELVCVNDQLNAGVWHIPVVGPHCGQIVKSGNQSVPEADFQTGEPHCGVCTIFLYELNLPLGKPCVGKPKSPPPFLSAS